MHVFVFVRQREYQMPTLTDQVIRRAWRMRDETGKIHYIAVFADGRQKRMIAKEGHWLYPILDSHLLALNYTGPKDNDAAAGEIADEAAEIAE